MGEAGGPTPSQPEPKSISESPKLSLTRRSFLIGAGAGAAAAGAVLGGAVVATKALNPTPTTTTTTTATQLGPTMRRVTLDIDGVKRDVIVDNRESLWETMNFQLGLSNSNLGCDRARPAAAGRRGHVQGLRLRDAVRDDRGLRHVHRAAQEARRHPRHQRQRADDHGQVGPGQALRAAGA